MMLKTAVFTPMPRARVAMTMAENPGDLENIRKACFRSLMHSSDARGVDVLLNFCEQLLVLEP